MKPRKLMIQAFGPYLKETVLDFTSLYSGGLFLITGATGCGKTTILDAMSFALYGRATGSVRDVRDMRSVSAPDSLETRVCFEFELGGSVYKFERGIRIREVKRRAGGVDRVPDYQESCSLLQGGEWRLLCSGPQVKEKAAELLGFSHEQFSQVVVLPQGEFRKLLTAPSLEKQKILEVLFGTSRWQAFTKALAERTKSLDTSLFEIAAHKSALLKGAECGEPELLKERLNHTETVYQEIAGAMKALSDAYAEASACYSGACEIDIKFTELETARKKLAELAALTQEMEHSRKVLMDSEKAEKLLPYLQAQEQAKAVSDAAEKAELESARSLETAEKEDAEAQKELESCAGGEEKLRELSANAAKLEAILGPAKVLGKAQEELLCKNQFLQKAKQTTAGAASELAGATQELDTLRKKIRENLEQNVAKVPELQAQLSQFETQKQTFQKLLEQEKITQKLQANLEKKRTEYKNVNQTLKNEKHVLEQMHAALDGDSACRLAQMLEEDTPCPVCGSKTHPSPAVPLQGVPTAEELQTQKTIVTDTEGKLRKIGEEGAKLSGEVQAAQNRLAELSTECDKFGQSEEKIEKSISEFTAALALTQKAALLQKSMEEKAKQLEEAVQRTKTDEANAKAAHDKLLTEVSLLGGRVEELKASVPEELRDVSVLQSKIDALRKHYNDLSELMQKVRKRTENSHSVLSAAKQRLISAKENTKTAKQRLDEAGKAFEGKFSLSELALGTDVRKIALSKQKQAELALKLEQYEREKLLVKDKTQRLSGQLGDAERPDLAALKFAAEEKRAAVEQAATQKGTLEAEIRNLQTIRKQLDEALSRETKLREQYALYNHLYRLCSGENAMKTPVHQFVLGLMLDDIVACANEHLWELSRGRYSLIRSSSLSRGGGTKGLDLSVEDAWGGGERSVTTLSGGEMFLASLSLAFGLSDVVQSYAGGIRLDSLFIDEGFGSLDTETLDTAMGALERLRQSGRLIGVISHVNELRSRISSHIEVSRLSDGSAKAAVFVP